MKKSFSFKKQFVESGLTAIFNFSVFYSHKFVKESLNPLSSVKRAVVWTVFRLPLEERKEAKNFHA
jgi:hypothetical protein